ncbi:hypothetical protein KGF54_001952 [Candida jiufengensis]|uniref:uncharacterized protein n=1 Tax=Candida jiufengensis TaxID=497108 RepID=UPI0022254D1C|nr:uncharacterized protein KGF54_001952 [Candida jiufengensis]KAI5954177.1 hypothetical protein KGF54_001952 [Candida jiufengensis]
MNHISIDENNNEYDIAFNSKRKPKPFEDIEPIDSSEEEDDEVQDQNELEPNKLPLANDVDEDDMFASEEEQLLKNNLPTVEVEDDDMFASDEEPSTTKKLQFSTQDQIEELSDMYSNEDESEPEEEEHDEETINYYTNAENYESNNHKKKKKQPKIEKFDLSEETQSGIIDEEGNLLKNESEEEIDEEDEYISQFSKSEIRKAKKAEEERIKFANNQQEDTEPIENILLSLIEILEPAETSLEALARLNTTLKRQKKQKLNINKAENDITIITNSCSKLSKKSLFEDVYDVTREEFMRKYQQETGVEYKNRTKRLREEKEEEEDESLKEEEIDYGEKIWEFKWIDDLTDTINGPYSEYEMYHWKQTYFENKVVVRKIGEDSFKHIQEINFQT